MTFDISEIIGKTLFGLKDVNIYHLPSTASGIIKTVVAGQPVGVVYSYVEREGAIWWQLQNSGYVKHQKGTFSTSALKDQGAIDELTKNTKPTTGAQVLETLYKTLKWALPLIAIAVIAYYVSKSYQNVKP